MRIVFSVLFEGKFLFFCKEGTLSAESFPSLHPPFQRGWEWSDPSDGREGGVIALIPGFPDLVPKNKTPALPLLRGWQRRIDRGSTLICRLGTDNAVTRVRLIPDCTPLTAGPLEAGRGIRRADSRMHSRRADAPLSAGAIPPSACWFGAGTVRRRSLGTASLFSFRSQSLAIFPYSIIPLRGQKVNRENGQFDAPRAPRNCTRRGMGAAVRAARDFRPPVLLTFPRKSATL